MKGVFIAPIVEEWVVVTMVLFEVESRVSPLFLEEEYLRNNVFGTPSPFVSL